ncbi:MAG: TOBE domain-containing protein [Steroidobacteraceae bacterium]
MSKMPSLQLGPKLAPARRRRRIAGGERIDLLEAIDRVGSISQAAKRLDLSYRAAWDAVDAINNLAAKPVLIRASGGPHGCSGYLTEYGREVVRLYRRLESGYQRLLMQMQAEVCDFEQLDALLTAITVRTSARNQFRGTIEKIRAGAVSAEVSLDIGDGLAIVAVITNDAVEDLGLSPGREAIALVKASSVRLSTGVDIASSAANRLTGVVVAVIPGSIDSEVKIQLPSGRILTAILCCGALRELDLADGSDCCAHIKASDVLIAVNG